MALSSEESTRIGRLTALLAARETDDVVLDAYYEGTQRLRHMGLAVPPALRSFEEAVNWPRLTVDSLEERIDVKSLMMPGEDVADPGLQEGWDANNLDSESSLVHLDAFIYGRSFACIGTNEDDREHPLVTVESPREVVAEVDPRTRRVIHALRLYGGTDVDPQPDLATLYLPDVTVWAQRRSGNWSEVDRDEHRLGRVPVVPFPNRRRAGRFAGVSEMVDVIPHTDAVARILTNSGVAMETHAVPQKWVLGVTRGDFVDASGNPIPAWEAYFTAIWANASKDAKVGQFQASDMQNFERMVNLRAALVAGVTGLPMRYLGQHTTNPPSADGIRADEARLVKRAERKMSTFGDQWGRVFAFYLRLRDGEWLDGNRIKVEWHDAGTPTYGAKVDGVQKLTGGKPILSVEGGWDELGWSEARKARERAYMEQEASDPTMVGLMRELATPAAPSAAGG